MAFADEMAGLHMFQFQMVRFKATERVEYSNGEYKFQFQMVRFKAIVPDRSTYLVLCFNSKWCDLKN